jgi:hypothetical protein
LFTPMSGLSVRAPSLAPPKSEVYAARL